MALVFGFVFSLSACDSIREASGPGTQTAETTAETADTEVTSPATDTISEQITDNTEAVQEETISAEPENDPASTTVKVQKTMLQMKIGETKVSVTREDNDSVAALKELCKDAPLTIQMSMYGGFEQVGPIGTRLPSNDAQTTTSAGDIVLYSSNQIVVFYGSNSWAYTRLGHITDQDAAGMASLLSNGNVTITISAENA